MFPFHLIMLASFAGTPPAGAQPTGTTPSPMTGPAPQGRAAKERWALDTRCFATETVLFNCPVGGGKVGSLCATSPTPPATVTWRFGTRSNIELTFPAEPRPVSDVFRWSQSTRLAFTIEAVDFTNDGVQYGLLDSSSYERGPDGEFAQSIVVTHTDGRVVITECRGGKASLGGMPNLGARTVEFAH